VGGRKLAEVGCSSMYTRSFRGGLGTNEECARADAAWESVVRLYRELVEGEVSASKQLGRAAEGIWRGGGEGCMRRQLHGRLL